MEKAIRMIEDAAAAGCEIGKFQSNVIYDEMIHEAKKSFQAMPTLVFGKSWTDVH